MTYNDIVAVIFLTPIVAGFIGLGALWMAYKVNQSMFTDDTDD